jgi:stage II sporulation protein AA (anti-sigma F factor antagonist)
MIPPEEVHVESNLTVRSSRPRPDVTLVEVVGELDTATVAQLAAELDPGTRHVGVDLGGLTFVDSSGIEVLVRAQKQAPGSLHLVGVQRSRAVTRVLDLFGLTGEFSQFADLDALLAELDGA